MKAYIPKTMNSSSMADTVNEFIGFKVLEDAVFASLVVNNVDLAGSGGTWEGKTVYAGDSWLMRSIKGVSLTSGTVVLYSENNIVGV